MRGEEVLALKNNLLYDAVATPNLYLEVRLADHWTMEMGAGFNPFPLSDTKFPKWRHLSVSVAPRYWFDEVFYHHFISVNAAYVHYNVAGGMYPIGWMYPQVKNNRYQGDAVMLGVSYGLHFPIAKHFSIELEGGIDAGYSWYDRFECKHCGTKTDHGGRWMFLPKLAVNIVVPFGIDHRTLERPCDCELEKDTALSANGDAAEPLNGENGDAAEPLNGANGDAAEPLNGENGDAAEPLNGENGDAAEPLNGENGDVAEPLNGANGDAAEPLNGENGDAAEPLNGANDANDAPIEEQVQRVAENVATVVESPEEAYVPYQDDQPLNADPRSTFFYFDVNETRMDSSILQNEVLMKSLQYVIGDALNDPTLRITRIQVVGLASFDGNLRYNQRLAASRANTIKKYIQGIYPIDDSVFDLSNGGENWAELRYIVQQMEFEGKDEVLRIIETEPNLDERERRIKQLNGGKTYSYIRDNMQQTLRNLGYITVFLERVKE